MAFLARILARPENEKPFIVLPVGYPSADCEVPALARKPLAEILIENPRPASGSTAVTPSGRAGE